MSIGSLRHKVEIQEKQIGEITTRGKQAFTWVELFDEVPAEIKTLGGRELEQARQVVAQATVKVTLRYRPEVTTANRIKFGSRIFAIGHLDNIDQRNKWLVATCTEEVG